MNVHGIALMFSSRHQVTVSSLSNLNKAQQCNIVASLAFQMRKGRPRGSLCQSLQQTLKRKSQVVVVHPLIPAVGRQRKVDLCDSEASLVYKS